MLCKLSMLLLPIVIGLVNGNHGLARIRHEKALFTKLNTGYDTQAVPFQSQDKGANVTVVVLPYYLTELKPEERKCNLYVWLLMDWNDPQLTWPPADYGEITRVNIDRSKVWIPDLVLNNGYGPKGLDFYRNSGTPVIAQSNGAVQLVTPVNFNGIIKHLQSPNGKVECVFNVGSWSYDKTRLDLAHLEIAKPFYTPNPAWDLVSQKATRKSYTMEGMTFVTADFEFVFQKKP